MTVFLGVRVVGVENGFDQIRASRRHVAYAGAVRLLHFINVRFTQRYAGHGARLSVEALLNCRQHRTVGSYIRSSRVMINLKLFFTFDVVVGDAYFLKCAINHLEIVLINRKLGKCGKFYRLINR